MNRYVKIFLHRGALFGGLGPIVAGIVFWVLELSLPDFSLGGGEVLLAVLSTYLLAFLQAGASVFQQIEHWPTAKATGLHFLTLYLAYSLCYLLNLWIPFEPLVLLIFTAVFVLGYFAVWLIVMLSLRRVGKRLNERLEK